MDALTVALASLGGVVLAGVVAHGAWQARRAGPKQAAPREEPGGLREPADATSPGDEHGEIEPGFERPLGASPSTGSMAGSLSGLRRGSPQTTLRLDALIDAFAPLTLEAPISGDALLAALPVQRHVGSKLMLIEGLNTESGQWESPVAGARYGELQAGVQLASRLGGLNEIEYSDFVQRVQALADAVGASADFPDMLDVMARARELDGFAVQHDAQLAVHLQARGPAWSVGYIQQQARRHGFVAGVVPGRLVLPAREEGAPPVLTLTFASQAALSDNPDRAAVRDATLAFDVPQTEASAKPFELWHGAAMALATDMEAALVDDNGQPLSEAGFAAIGSELDTLYATLEAHDLVAGSAAARRLFN